MQFAKEFTRYHLVQKDIVIGVILYYFIGMVISRIGSLVLEPFLKWIGFLRFSDYNKFITASKQDEKIELFSEVNNTYRTISAMFVLLVLAKGYDYYQKRWCIPDQVTLGILVVFTFTLFLVSYRKQTNYIRKRIEANHKSNAQV